MARVTLVNCDPDGITLLFDVLRDVEAILRDAGPRPNKMIAMNAVKYILSDALERHRRGGDDTGSYESLNPSERERGAGDPEHINDDSGVEGWEFERLCKWILNQIRANLLEEDGRCKEIVDKLEARCGLANPKTAQGASTQVTHPDTPRGGPIKVAHDSSPISLLPVEILQQIFRLAALPHLWIRAPLVLSLVNSHFRTIVLDTPSLWTTVDNTLPLPILQLYIARSSLRNEPLDVLTKTDYPYSYEAWYDLLYVESTRIKHMAVVGSYSDLLSDWGRGLRPEGRFTFTSLTTLALRVINGKDEEALCPQWLHFPDLRELWIQGCWSSGWVGPGDPFPPTLRRLRLSKIRLVCLLDLVEALHGVLGLVSLTMEGVALDPDERSVPETTGPVDLNFLEELELANVPIADISEMWPYVSAPNLSSFSITSPGPSDEIAELVETFAFKHPQLSSLRILGSNVSWKVLSRATPWLDNLTHLHIRASDLTDNYLAVLKEETFFSRLTVVVC